MKALEKDRARRYGRRWNWRLTSDVIWATNR